MHANLALLAVLVLSGCAAAPSASPSPSPASDVFQPTPWELELANGEPDGTRSLDSALRLFAMAFGPVPGVEVPPDPGPILSATLAVRLVTNRLDELTAEQRSAVQEYLNAPSDEYLVEPAVARGHVRVFAAGFPGLAAGPAAQVPADAVRAPLLAKAAFFRAEAASRWGDFVGRMSVYFTTASYAALSSSSASQHGADFFCGIYLNLNDLSGADQPTVEFALAHEVFHCAQDAKIFAQPSLGGFLGWTYAGQARYFALQVATDPSPPNRAWLEYMGTPETPLFERTYDAVGFWGHLAYSLGGNVYAAMGAALTTGISEEAFIQTGANADAFLDTWASGLFRGSALGWSSAWETDGPELPPALRAPVNSLPVDNGDVEVIERVAYSNRLYRIESTADVLRFEIYGRSRLGDGTVDTPLFAPALYCTRDDGCSPCPGQPFTELTYLNAISILAVSGGMFDTTGTVSGEELDECETPRPSPSPPTPCKDGCATSAGDVHIVTVDASEYDFQAAGEFVLLRSEDGSFELQARQEPWEDDRNISINTAAAVLIGDSRLAIFEANETVSITLDGNPVDLTQPLVLVGATVDLEEEGFVATFADGTVVYAFGLVGDGVNVVFQPSAGLAESGRGLFGRVVAGSMGVPALPDGTVLPATDDRAAYQAALYETFANAWRVTPETSLFDYVAGASTETYTLPDFPDSLLTLADLTPEQRAMGEAACDGIDDAVLQQMCVFDVGVTNDLGFTTMYDITENVVETGTIATSETVEATRPPP